jgi:hypothetical protein
MAQLLNADTTLIRDCIDRLQAGYRSTFKFQAQHYASQIAGVAKLALNTIAQGNAPYHNVEHTVLVALVGQELLRGKYRLEGDVTPDDWLHFMVSLLCHDIGYIRGVCKADNLTQNRFVTGVGDQTIQLLQNATDASLTPFHVDRGKQFVEEQFAHHPLLDLDRLKLNIELTRFPVPNDELHCEVYSYPALARVADLVGQLSDSHYLTKIPALFSEMVEIGSHKLLHCCTPYDLRANYPKFYRNTVCPYIEPGLNYLSMTPQGIGILAGLYTNVAIVDNEQLVAA